MPRFDHTAWNSWLGSRKIVWFKGKINQVVYWGSEITGQNITGIQKSKRVAEENKCWKRIID